MQDVEIRNAGCKIWKSAMQDVKHYLISQHCLRIKWLKLKEEKGKYFQLTSFRIPQQNSRQLSEPEKSVSNIWMTQSNVVR
jgi:hypothetical protein